MAVTFKLNPEPTFRASVPIPVPGGGSMALDLEFRHKTRAALHAWYDSFEGRDGDAARAEAECLHEVVAGWHNCEAIYSLEALTTLLENYPQAGGAILAAYTRELTGARLGN